MNWNLSALQTHLESLPGFNQLLVCCGTRTTYLVGGTLRDWILQRPLKDIDLVTPGDPTELAREFEMSSGGRWFWLDEKRLQSRVVIKNDDHVIFYDFAPLRGADLDADLAARDFTINALAVSLSHSPWEWTDPLHAANDFPTQILRRCSDSAFREDPLRCLRAVRFFLLLDFSPDSKTLSLIQESVPDLERIPGERIHAELALIFGSPLAYQCLVFFEQLGLTTELFGAALSNSASSLLSEQLKQIKPLKAEQLTTDSVVANGFTGRALLRLFHLFAATGTTSAIQAVCDRLRLGRRNTQALVGLAELSSREIPSLPSTQRGKQLWLEDLPGDKTTSLLFLLQRNALTETAILDLLQLLESLPQGERLLPLVSATEVQELLGIPPGPGVGKAINLLRQAELQGLIRGRSDAIAFLHGLPEKGD